MLPQLVVQLSQCRSTASSGALCCGPSCKCSTTTQCSTRATNGAYALHIIIICLPLMTHSQYIRPSVFSCVGAQTRIVALHRRSRCSGTSPQCCRVSVCSARRSSRSPSSSASCNAYSSCGLHLHRWTLPPRLRRRRRLEVAPLPVRVRRARRPRLPLSRRAARLAELQTTRTSSFSVARPSCSCCSTRFCRTKSSASSSIRYPSSTSTSPTSPLNSSRAIGTAYRFICIHSL